MRLYFKLKNQKCLKKTTNSQIGKRVLKYFLKIIKIKIDIKNIKQEKVLKHFRSKNFKNRLF